MRCNHDCTIVYTPGLCGRAFRIENGSIESEFQHELEGLRYVVRCKGCGARRRVPTGKRKPPRWVEDALAVVDALPVGG